MTKQLNKATISLSLQTSSKKDKTWQNSLAYINQNFFKQTRNVIKSYKKLYNKFWSVYFTRKILVSQENICINFKNNQIAPWFTIAIVQWVQQGKIISSNWFPIFLMCQKSISRCLESRKKNIKLIFQGHLCRDLLWVDTWQIALTSQNTLLLDTWHPFASVRTCSIS